MLVLHGTTKELSFLDNEFKKTSCWSCSESDDYVYVWNPSAFAKDFQEVYIEPPAHAFNDESDCLAVCEAFRYAKDSSYMQAGFQGKNTQCIVYVLNVPEKHLEEDTSCPNMSEALRFRKAHFDSSWIVGKYTKDFSAYDSPFLVASLLKNEYFNDSSLDEKLYRLAKAIFNSPASFESVYCNLIDELQQDWTLSDEYPIKKCCNMQQTYSPIGDLYF